MKTYKVIGFCFYALVYSFLLYSCSDPVLTPSDISVEELLSAPEIVSFENQSLKLETTLYLNLQPIVSKNPMVTLISLQTIDSSVILSNIKAKAVYVVKDGEVWKSFFSSDKRTETEPFKISEVAREGPNWGPNIYVDVIVMFELNNKNYLIKASNQFIDAVY
ncbi:MAG: hypothetical protein WAV89_02190 [Ignavibacteriaceae bacterium]